MAIPNPKTPPRPDDWLKTASSIAEFTELLFKIKNCAQSSGEVRLSWKECQQIIWGLQLMRGPKDG